MKVTRTHIATAALLFAYVLGLRTYDVSTTFLMLGEQTRDWTIALGGITELPLVGAPSTAGGRGFGPAYYWLLWLGRVTLGPFMDNLPHAGGIIVALVQSIGDTWLFIALSRRIPWTLSLATCLLIASGPFDIAISSVIWNPPVSAALIKMAIACALMISFDTAIDISASAASPLRRDRDFAASQLRRGRLWEWQQVALTAALGWMAVQAHLSAVFVAAPLLIGVVVQPLFINRSAFAESARSAVIVIGVVLLLQVPFVISLLTEPSAPAGPTTALASITNSQTFDLMKGLDIVTGVTGNIVKPMPDEFTFWIPTLVAAAIALVTFRRDAIVLGTTIGAVATASLVFATWTGSYDRYWFLTMVPALVLLLALPIGAIPWRPAVMVVGAALVALFATWQPARIAESERFFEYPQYETMVRASREIVVRAPVVRDIVVTFDVHPTMDRTFIYRILGGRIDSSALYTAVIDADGSVRLATD